MNPELKQFLEEAFTKHHGDFNTFVTKANEQMQGMRADLNNLQLRVEGNAFSDRGSGSYKSLGHQVANDPQVKSFIEQGHRNSGRIAIKSFFETKAAITTDTAGSNVVAPMRMAGLIMPGQERLTIRDLLTVQTTTSNAVEFVRSTFTGAAKIIWEPSPSPGRRENVLKPEASMEFSLERANVETLAHWIPASRQILDDLAGLQAYIDGELRYKLKIVEEDELLNGDGTHGHLDGLINQATAYDTDLNASGDTAIDTIGHAIAQAEDASDFEVDGIVLNNMDWASIRMQKNVQGDYVFVSPTGMAIPQLWNRPVVATKRMTKGRFLVGSFRIGATLWDRMQAVVEISREHADFFVRNMAAILCEERLAFSVQRPSAFVYGAF